ncbi:MAG: kinase [Deltaproteobacteria bacterium]|nr:kinase [Deltaproteobacteria bacterium]
MIITRTPFRISFFGGGTDYPVWTQEQEGAVLATTIDKYCYITCRYLPPFFKHRSRIIYSRMEMINEINEIQHPSVRACLRFLNILRGIEIHHDADLPARTGIGSSSSFTVGLLNALYALIGKMSGKEQLYQDAIHIEQRLIQENVGSQDQVMAACGGFNVVRFKEGNRIFVQPITLDSQRLRVLKSHLLLYFTGFSRFSSDVASEQIQNTPVKKQELKAMYEMVFEAIHILNSGQEITQFGKLLHESWMLKKSLSSKITTPFLDEIYAVARKEGALGGKILGAGGGGFMLLFASPEYHPKIKEKLKDFLYVPFEFENLGSQVIYYAQPQEF